MKFCPECGYKLTGTPKFCPECGAKLQGEGASPAGGADWEAELADIGEKLDEQIGEYENKLALAKSYVLREKYAEAEKAYEELIEKNPQDMAGYIGLICTATRNYTKYEGGEIDKAIRIAQRVAGNARAEDFDEEYAKYAARRKKYFEDKEAAEAETRRREQERTERETRRWVIRNRELKKYTGEERDAAVPDEVTSIGERAFAGNAVLQTAMGEYAFSECKNLKSISLPAGVQKIGDFAFFCCDQLKAITIPAAITAIGTGTFQGCKNLTNVTLPAGMEKIGESAFSECDNLTNVTLPAGVKEIGAYAFANCTALTSVTGGSVITIGAYAFAATALTSFTGDSVQTVGDYAFAYCYALASASFGTSLTTIGEGAFTIVEGGTAVAFSLTIAATGAPTLGADAFANRTELKVYVPSAAVDAYQAAEGWSDYMDSISAIAGTETGDGTDSGSVADPEPDDSTAAAA